jgi:hypothetical protein
MKGLGEMISITRERVPSTRWKVVGAMLVVAIGFALPGVALAAGSTGSNGGSAASDQYDKPAKAVAAASGGSTGGSYKPPVATPASTGTLPFTGMSLIWPAVAAVGLIGLGVALRRHDRKG